ncbi:hypothetical protein ACFPN7_23485 [Amycolatopsis halotolerans]|uniref:hypothetical protein n=1 Tax=Amycolatopsis halotolerans TaxID=330083 RepID=UPI003607EE73
MRNRFGCLPTDVAVSSNCSVRRRRGLAAWTPGAGVTRPARTKMRSVHGAIRSADACAAAGVAEVLLLTGPPVA